VPTIGAIIGSSGGVGDPVVARGAWSAERSHEHPAVPVPGQRGRRHHRRPRPRPTRQHADNHHWEPPGGLLELNESIEDGQRREACEETGLDTDPDQFTTGGNLGPNDETAAFRWASEDDIRELATEVYAIRVLDALGPGTSPVPHATTAPALAGTTRRARRNSQRVRFITPCIAELIRI